MQILTEKALQPTTLDVAEGNVRLSYTKQGGHCGTKFTGFTGTKVQFLTLVRLSYTKQGGHCGTKFIGFTGKKVQFLTLVRLSYTKQGGHCGTEFTCFTGTKVQFLTLVRLSYTKQGGHCVLSFIALMVQNEYLLYWYKSSASRTPSRRATAVLSLLALLVQKYQY